MKIKHTVQDKTVLFKDLNVGDVFKIDSDYFMRIYKIYDTHIVANVVNLSSGQCHVVEDLTPVIYLNAELCVDD